MIQGMQLGFVQEYAALLVARKGVVLVRVPQALHDRKVLGRAAIANRVVDVLLEPVVSSRALEAGGDHVPARAPTADQVQGTELSRDVEGLGVGSGERGDEANALGCRSNGGEQCQRFQTVEE